VAEVVGEDIARTTAVPENVGVVALDDIRLHDVPIGGRPAERSRVDDGHPTLERRGARWRVPGYEVAGHKVVVRTKERDAKSRQCRSHRVLIERTVFRPVIRRRVNYAFAVGTPDLSA